MSINYQSGGLHECTIKSLATYFDRMKCRGGCFIMRRKKAKNESIHYYKIVKHTKFIFFQMFDTVALRCSANVQSLNSFLPYLVIMFTSIKPSLVLIREFISETYIGSGGLIVNLMFNKAIHGNLGVKGRPIEVARA